MTGRIEFSPLRPEDLAGLPPVSAEGVQLGASLAEAAAHMTIADLAWAGRISGRLAGAAGLVKVRTGTLQAWAYLDRGFGVPAVRALVGFARGILDLGHAKGFWRIECVVRSDLPAGIKLALALGFRPEGIAVQWSADRVDAVQFGRVKGDR